MTPRDRVNALNNFAEKIRFIRSLRKRGHKISLKEKIFIMKNFKKFLEIVFLNAKECEYYKFIRGFNNINIGVMRNIMMSDDLIQKTNLSNKLFF